MATIENIGGVEGVIIHFSCGATSAIAGALALRSQPDAEIIYANPGGEHEDNLRFLKDCEEKLFHKKVTVLANQNYFDLYDFLEFNKVISFISGAPCTAELKKEVIREYLGEKLLTHLHVYGYDTGEIPRIERYKSNNPEIQLWLPLIDNNLSKANCLAILQKLEIEIPMMYKLGYEHSNCIGCVKAANINYWSAIREDFPKVFSWMAQHERSIGALDPATGVRKGAAINKKYVKGTRERLFLDELPKDIVPKRDLEISCGYSCGNISDLLMQGRENPISETEDISDIVNKIQELI